MQKFEIEDNLVEVVWQLANPKPFETLTFNDALRKILKHPTESTGNASQESLKQIVERMLAEVVRPAKKAPTPSAAEWASSVPDLNIKSRPISWKKICDEVGIDPAGDSARRKLKAWVAGNRPKWTPVPDPEIDGDSGLKD